MERIEGFWLQNGEDHPLLLQKVDPKSPDSPPSISFTSERLAQLRVEVGSPTILETERLILREVRPGDADAFQSYMLPEPYWRHDPRTPPTPESVASLVERFTRSQSQEPRMDFFLTAVDKISDEFIGEASLRIRGSNSLLGAIGYGVVSGRKDQGTRYGNRARLAEIGFRYLKASPRGRSVSRGKPSVAACDGQAWDARRGRIPR